MQPTVHPEAVSLIEALEVNPTFASGEPSVALLEFLERIETADHAAFSDDEDNTNECWGHYQFTAGILTCTSVLNSWDSIGSASYACRLVAATLTTCHVARWLCRDRTSQPSFLSDSYLTEITSLLWSCWRSAGGVRGIADNIISRESNKTIHPANCERQRKIPRARGRA